MMSMTGVLYTIHRIHRIYFELTVTVVKTLYNYYMLVLVKLMMSAWHYGGNGSIRLKSPPFPMKIMKVRYRSFQQAFAPRPFAFRPGLLPFRLEHWPIVLGKITMLWPANKSDHTDGLKSTSGDIRQNARNA